MLGRNFSLWLPKTEVVFDGLWLITWQLTTLQQKFDHILKADILLVILVPIALWLAVYNSKYYTDCGSGQTKLFSSVAKKGSGLGRFMANYLKYNHFTAKSLTYSANWDHSGYFGTHNFLIRCLQLKILSQTWTRKTAVFCWLLRYRGCQWGGVEVSRYTQCGGGPPSCRICLTFFLISQPFMDGFSNFKNWRQEKA